VFLAVSSQSLASETSSDYALPPDDEVSIQTDSSDTSEPEQKLLRYTTENIKKVGNVLKCTADMWYINVKLSLMCTSLTGNKPALCHESYVESKISRLCASLYTISAILTIVKNV
jgi:hypothetical protein